MKKIIRKIILGLIIIVISLGILSYLAVTIAHFVVFSRKDYKDYNTDKFITYDDIDYKKYERELVQIPSGKNMLTAYLYGGENDKGLVVISPGLGDCNDIKLYEITDFVDRGWMVLCYDYTGCFNSEGKSMIDYSQAPKDLNNVLDYIENNERFKQLDIMLFGHSLGAYSTSIALEKGHNIKAAIVASGFDTPMEQWQYCIEKYTGKFSAIFKPFAQVFMKINYGRDAYLSAIDGINSVDIPILVISGTDDEFYGGESKIYKNKDRITNKNCTFMLMNNKNHNGHYNYFLTDEAVEYDNKVEEGKVKKIDKNLYMQHDEKFMDELNKFYEAALN